MATLIRYKGKLYKEIRNKRNFIDDADDDWKKILAHSYENAIQVIDMLQKSVDLLKDVDKKIQEIYYENPYFNSKGLRVGIGSEAIQAVNLKNVITNLQNKCNEIKKELKL